MEVHVSYLAVLLSAAASMAIGSVWYARAVFGKTWIRLAKVDEKKMKSRAPQALAIAFLLSLLMAFVLAHLAFFTHQFFQGSFMTDSVLTALWAWLGVAFTRVLMRDTFEGRPIELTAINLGNMLVTMLAMGVIIGLFKP